MGNEELHNEELHNEEFYNDEFHNEELRNEELRGGETDGEAAGCAEQQTQSPADESSVRRTDRLWAVADKVLGKVEDLLENGAEPSSQALKHLSGVLKDIRDVQMLRSAADKREQEARIRKLLKQAEEEEKKDTAIVVRFALGAEEYAQ